MTTEPIIVWKTLCVDGKLIESMYENFIYIKHHMVNMPLSEITDDMVGPHLEEPLLTFDFNRGFHSYPDRKSAEPQYPQYNWDLCLARFIIPAGSWINHGFDNDGSTPTILSNQIVLDKVYRWTWYRKFKNRKSNSK